MLYDEADSKKPGGIRVCPRRGERRGLGVFRAWTHRGLRQVGDGSGIP